MADALDPYISVLASLASTDEITDAAFRKLMLASTARQNQTLEDIRVEIKKSNEELILRLNAHTHEQYVNRSEYKASEDRLIIVAENVKDKYTDLKQRVDAWQNRAIGIGIGAALTGIAGGAGVAALVTRLFGSGV